MIRDFLRGAMTVSALAALSFSCSDVRAQIAVSANGGKIALVDGVNTVPPNPGPDTVTILDLGASPPKITGTVKLSNSPVGICTAQQ
jgi:hypothetical protein